MHEHRTILQLDADELVMVEVRFARRATKYFNSTIMHQRRRTRLSSLQLPIYPVVIGKRLCLDDLTHSVLPLLHPNLTHPIGPHTASQFDTYYTPTENIFS